MSNQQLLNKSFLEEKINLKINLEEMLTEVNYIDRISGISLYYNGLGSYYQQKNSKSILKASASHYFHPVTPPYSNGYDFLMPISEEYQKFYAIEPTTPPQSPVELSHEIPKTSETLQRTSVIMKVENSQVKPVRDVEPAEDIVCKWINCYR